MSYFQKSVWNGTKEMSYVEDLKKILLNRFLVLKMFVVFLYCQLHAKIKSFKYVEED